MDSTLLWPVGLTVLLLIGAYSDVTTRRLPNWLALALLVFGLAHGFAVEGLADVPWYFAHTVAALVVGMILYALGVVGAGDAKFYAGTASYFILWKGLELLLAVSLAGLALILLWIIVRRFRGIKARASDGDFGKFPYGVAIAAGGIIAAFGQFP